MEGDLRWCCGSSSNDDDWDLHAVVRFASCSGAGGESRVTSPQSQKDDELTDAAAAALQQPPIGPAPAVDDFGLQQAFFAATPPQPRNEAPPQPPPAKPQTSCRNNGVGGLTTRSKRKRKKSQVSNNKEVKRVAVGASPAADPWAWRKYGQKPIKGSPYPRGYYRCSTDKDCRARKQVERCRTDPGTLIVTYTGGEHSHPAPLHRNALAGTTRNHRKKPQQAPGDEEHTAVAAGASMLLEEDAEMEGEEEDDVLLFLEPSSPSPSNGSSGSKVIPELHEPAAPGADDNGRGGSQKAVVPLSKLHELPFPATTSSSRTGDGAAAAPAAATNVVTDEKCPFSGLTPWEAAAVAAATNWG